MCSMPFEPGVIRFPLLLLVTCVVACGWLLPSLSVAADDDPNTRDLKVMSSWFEGEWDNDEQIWFETDHRENRPTGRRHGRIHSMHRRIDLPSFGTHVFYVEEYRDGDSDKVSRQRLITFESKKPTVGVRSRLFFFHRPDAVRGGYFDPRLLASLTRDDVFTIESCAIEWVPEGGQYRGTIPAKRCEFGESGERRWSQHEVLLSSDKYWRVDRSFQVKTGKLAVGFPDDEPYKLRRANRFDCNLNFAEDYLRGPMPGDQSEKGLSIHSQGGEFTVKRVSNGISYTVRLRQREYAYYDENSDFMFLLVRETGKPFIAYSLHDADARLIGMNLNWMNLSCRRVVQVADVSQVIRP